MPSHGKTFLAQKNIVALMTDWIKNILDRCEHIYICHFTNTRRLVWLYLDLRPDLNALGYIETSAFLIALKRYQPMINPQQSLWKCSPWFLTLVSNWLKLSVYSSSVFFLILFILPPTKYTMLTQYSNVRYYHVLLLSCDCCTMFS